MSAPVFNQMLFQTLYKNQLQPVHLKQKEKKTTSKLSYMLCI